MAAIVLTTGAVIRATSQHPIWDATTRAFTYATDLRPGDRLLESDGSTVAIRQVRHYQADVTAYNLDVDGIHTYYVLAGRTAVLVHNSCLTPDLMDLATQHVTGSGDTVLGRFPGYIAKATSKGGSYFDIGSKWDDLSSAGIDPWELNKYFLDTRIAAGDRILLSVPNYDIPLTG